MLAAHAQQASTPHRVTEHEGEHHMDFPPRVGGWANTNEGTAVGAGAVDWVQT